MNKAKREEMRKHEEARRGLYDSQIATLNLEVALKGKVQTIAFSIHVEKFPEEYDFIYDSYVDANSRRKGINPMSQEYIEQIQEKRKSLGVSQLSDNGLAVSKDTFVLCENEAKKQIYADVALKRPPAKTCNFCNRSLNEIGGKRLIAQKSRGVSLSNHYRGGGNSEFSHQSVKLFDDSGVYVVVWGEQGLWTQSAIEKAKNEFIAGYHPWFCQICGHRACRQCGSPVNNPFGSDHLNDDGSSSHAPIIAGGGGCCNPSCEKYRT